MEDNTSYHDSDEDMDNFELQIQPEKTIIAMNWVIKKFKQWNEKTNSMVDLKKDLAMLINSTLRKFYFELRKANGEMYPAVTLRGIRAGLHRYIILPPNPRSGLNILEDPVFMPSNKMLNSMAKAYAKTPYSQPPQKKKTISASDTQKLGQFLCFAAYETAENLVLAVWFSLCHFMGKRGNEVRTIIIIAYYLVFFIRLKKKENI